MKRIPLSRFAYNQRRAATPWFPTGRDENATTGGAVAWAALVGLVFIGLVGILFGLIVVAQLVAQ